MQTTNSLFNNASSTGSAQDGSAITGNTAAQTQDMFTKLLVAQIKNQDPLSPSDPAQFVQQLTQLSQTESLQNMSTLTSNNASILQSMQMLALGAQVGNDVMVQSDTIAVDGSGAKIKGEMTLQNANAATTLVLTGSDGVSHKVSLGTQAPGTVPFAVDPAALGLAPDSYKVRVETSSKETPTIDLEGRLNSVRLTAAGAVLSVNGVGEVQPAAIAAFNGKSTATQSL